MFSFTLDYHTTWQSLPWYKIHEKVFILQRKIYQYSKDCDMDNLYRLQNYLINSSDIKILATQIILDSINEYYLTCNQKKYFFNDVDKSLIYESLYITYLNNNELSIILNKIKQYIIYLCIKPEWEARLEPIYRSNFNYLSESYFIERLTKYINLNSNNKLENENIYCINSLISNKYIDIIYLNKKMQSLNMISNYLNICLQQQDLSESLNLQIKNYIGQSNLYANLYKLVHKIILNGITWFNMISMQTYQIFTYNIMQNIYISFDKNNHYWIISKYYILNQICFENIKIFHFCLGLYNNLYNDHYSINRNIKRNLISDYSITYFYQNINPVIIQIKPSIYKQFLNQLKQIIYAKNILGKYRLKTQKTIYKYFNELDVKFIDFFKFYNPVIDLNNLDSLFHLFNQISYKSLKYTK